MMTRMTRFVALAAFAIAPVVAHAEVRLEGEGSTFINPLAQRWVTEYQKLHPDVLINYRGTGSGAGIKAVTNKTVDFAGTDAPLGKKEAAAMNDKAIHLPAAAGAVVLAYNLNGVSDLKLSGDVIADIFAGKITKWNDAKIAALNNGAALPDTAIAPCYRSDGSGTTFIFTHYLSAVSPSFESSIGAGKQVSFPVGQGAKGNDGVTAAVKQTNGAIGYIELNYALANKIDFAQVQNASGKFIKATPAAVTAAANSQAVQDKLKDSLAVSLWNQTGDDVYPICSFTYLLVYSDLSNVKTAEQAKALADFLAWALSQDGGQKINGELDYAALSVPVSAKEAEVLSKLTYNGQPLK